MKKNWRTYFAPHIIERGYDLYYRGAVRWVQGDDRHDEWLVNDRYHVVIINDQDLFQAGSCDCPYAMKHHFCKHMAACLIALENRAYTTYDTIDLERMIIEMGEQKKNQMIKQVLLRDHDLLEEFLSQNNSFHALAGYRLNEIFIDHSNGKIDDILFERKLYEFMESLYQKQDDVLWVCHYLQQLLLRLQNLKNQNTYVNAIGLENQALHLLETMLSHPKACQNIFDFMSRYPMYDHFLDFLFDHFREEPYLSKKYDLIEQCIAALTQFESWAKDYYLEYYLLKKLMVLYDLKRIKEYRALTEKYWYYAKIREFWITEAMNRKAYSRALNILSDCLKETDGKDHQALKYYRMQTDIYELLRDERYPRCLAHLLYEMDPGDFDDYQRYKALFTPEKWAYERAKLLKTPMSISRKMDILRAEKAYGTLMSIIVSQLDVYYLLRYEALFKQDCLEMLLHAYEEMVFCLAKEATEKNQYQEIAVLLKKIEEIDQTGLAADLIVRQLHKNYPRKRALLTLLKCFIRT